MNKKRYKRNSTSTTTSIFYEQNCLGKYKYDPPYQRDYNVWDKEQKSFLIDTIFKNFPMPPVFLEQKIVDGKTTYDVIDGKQRLNTIIEFIENKVTLPQNFGDDIYGNKHINGKSFEDIKAMATKDKDIEEYVENFWSYVINIEYIERPSEKIVDEIFDRLNRGGERLNNAELRKAKYYDTVMYQGIKEISKIENISVFTKRLDSTRMDDISFLTEIYLLILSKSIIGGTESDIDKEFIKYVERVSDEVNYEILRTTRNIIEIFLAFDLDLNSFEIQGTSHLYALIYLSLYLYLNKIGISQQLKSGLQKFYSDLRGDKKDNNVQSYSASMQSASKSKTSRKKRISSLCNYLGFTKTALLKP